MECNRIIPEQPAKWKDRRCSARHRVKTLAYVDLGLDNGGVLINVGEGGLSFQGIQSLVLGQRHAIGFKLPGIDRSFKATGEVAWLGDSRKGGGLRFIELPEDVRKLIKEWNGAMVSDDLGEQPTSRTSQIDSEKDHPRPLLRALVQRNRPPASMNNNLADLIRDSSLSRDAVIAAVNTSRSKTAAAHSTDFMDDVEVELNRRLVFVALLYIQRRTNPYNPEVSLIEVERRMGVPRNHLEFTTWYLQNKGYITRADNADFQLTVEGVDFVESQRVNMASMSEDLFNDDEVSTADDEENEGLVDEGQGPACKECGEFLDGAGCPTCGRCKDCCECSFSDDLL